jgi:hypothetical protein
VPVAAVQSAASGMDPAWLTALVALVVAVFGFLAWGARWAWRILRSVSRFLDDYAGQPARDGMAARPGFMARLSSAEEALAHVVAETKPNHGTSLRDVVHQTAQDVASIKKDQASMRARIELWEKNRAGREGTSG